MVIDVHVQISSSHVVLQYRESFQMLPQTTPGGSTSIKNIKEDPAAITVGAITAVLSIALLWALKAKKCAFMRAPLWNN
jgi:hypothetical protein